MFDNSSELKDGNTLIGAFFSAYIESYHDPHRTNH